LSKECMREIECIFKEYAEDFEQIDELIRKHNLPSYLSSSFREFLEQRVISKAVAEVIEKDQVRKSLARQAENMKYFYECLIKAGFDDESAKAIVTGGAYSAVESRFSSGPGELDELE